MAKSIRDLLPGKEQVSLVQAKIECELASKVRTQMIKDDITWKELLTAAFKRYLDESKHRAAV